MAATTESTKPVKRNDAYTGLLAISFLALVGASVLMYFELEKYGGIPPKSPDKMPAVDVPGVVRPAPKAEPTPGPGPGPGPGPMDKMPMDMDKMPMPMPMPMPMMRAPADRREGDVTIKSVIPEPNRTPTEVRRTGERDIEISIPTVTEPIIPASARIPVERPAVKVPATRIESNPNDDPPVTVKPFEIPKIPDLPE